MRGNARMLNDLIRVRTQVENFVDRLIRTLDRIDVGTEDLEECDLEDDGTLEPSLGATESFDQRKSWRGDGMPTPDLERDSSCVCVSCKCGNGSAGALPGCI